MRLVDMVLFARARILAVTGLALVGSVVSILARGIQEVLFPEHALFLLLHGAVTFSISTFVLFACLTVFYKLAPRRPTRLAEIWKAAGSATLALRVLDGLFLVYLDNFGRFNLVYSASGGFMALMLWVYLSGSVVIFGACCCAAQADLRSIR